MSRLFGSLAELVKIVFRVDGQEVSVQPNSSTTYTANRIVELPVGDAATELVGTDSTQAITNKTYSGTQANIDNLRLDGNTLSSTNTNGDITLDPDGTGAVSIAATTRLQSGSDLVFQDDDNSHSIALGIPSAVTTNRTPQIPDDTGDVVLTSATQVITAKDIDGGTASNISRLTVPSNTKANLDALTRKEATVVYASDENKLYADNGSVLVEVGGGGAGGNTELFETSSNYLITDVDGYRTIAVTTGASTITVTLPTAADNDNRIITVTKVDAGSGTVVVTSESSELATDYILYFQSDSVEVQCAGTAWVTLQNAQAAETRPGLLNRYYKGSFTLDNNFSSGTMQYSVINDIVFLRLAGSASHTSAATASTSAGLIPAAIRPSGDQYNIKFAGSGGTVTTIIKSNGTFTVEHRNWSGTGISGSVINDYSICYRLED